MAIKSYQEAYRMWGVPGRGTDRLSVLDLLRNGTLDVETASLLWLLVERKSSIIVAAVPQLAGKTTLLTALADFMPSWFGKVYTRGRDEDFSFLWNTDPSSTYLLVPELSDHTPAYLWGDDVRILFETLEKGYSLAATIHADTPEEVIALLAGAPVHVPRGMLHHAGVIVNIYVDYSNGELVRSVGKLTLVRPGPTLVTLGEFEGADGAFALSDSAQASLGEHLGMPRNEMASAMAEKAGVLQAWLTGGAIDISEMQRLVQDYYPGSHSTDKPV